MESRGSPLTTDLAGLLLRNPVMLAAGTAGTLDEMGSVLDLSRVGAVVTKSITSQPREGNATWRILESKAGMLNAIGLANVGLSDFEAHVSPRVAGMPTTVVGSVAGFSVEDYVRVAGAMGDIEGIAAVELNVSCPNVRHGTEFGADPRLLRDLVGAVRAALPRTRLIVKLSPVAIGTPHGIADLARSAIEAGGVPSGPNLRPGADALTIANTVPAMAIDPTTRRPRLANVTGGLSGPAVHPIAVKLVYDAYRLVCRDTGTPIIGCGGVQTWEDAAELILAGASAVQLGTALFADPRAPLQVIRGLERWVQRQRVGSIMQLVGGVVTDA
ncbi:MAG: dihydroorotate dehydrogenase [Phycisphaeraceae bacterium]|nr:dihydroorotate dehydrogenase [Phycisphaeraceae bacterium]